MDPSVLTSRIEHFSPFSEAERAEVEQLCRAYPCLAAAQLLLARDKAARNPEAGREMLAALSLMMPADWPVERFLGLEGKESSGAGDAFDLIDAFLEQTGDTDHLLPRELLAAVPAYSLEKEHGDGSDLAWPDGPLKAFMENPQERLTAVEDSSSDEASASLGDSAGLTGDSADFTGDSAGLTGDSADFTSGSSGSLGGSADGASDEAARQALAMLDASLAEMPECSFTETLAKIYLRQKKYAKALEIIKTLPLKYPEKSIYFADQIKYLEILINHLKK